MAFKESDISQRNLIAVIGDEDTCAGFVLAGIGERTKDGLSNFLIVEPGKTRHDQIVSAFRRFTSKENHTIGLVLITQSIADEIRYLINEYTNLVPTVIEIPNKDKPYDETKDPIFQQVQKLLGKD